MTAVVATGTPGPTATWLAIPRRYGVVLLFLLPFLLLAACAPPAAQPTAGDHRGSDPVPPRPGNEPAADPGPASDATADGHPQTIERYGVLELDFPWPSGAYVNPWEQVQVGVTLTRPSGETVTIGGFYHSPGSWKARYAPDETGSWAWTARIGDGTLHGQYAGTFEVVDSERAGFVRPNPENPLRWVFDDGSPYYPIGLGDCLLGPEGGSPLDNFGFDGEVRDADHPEGRRTDLETYLTAYGQAGFNLFRWSLDNCAFGLYETIAPAGNVYRQVEGLYGDRLVRSLREHGLRVYMVIFGFSPPFPNGSHDPAEMAAVERYVDYVVARYGAYVDFWELMNEAPNPPMTVDDGWYLRIATHLRATDPYDHPISTSWQRPDLDVIDINSPHWYERESEFESDLALLRQLEHAGADGSKPVVFGEQGNSEANWDDRSALRMRIRSWTAFFKEVVLVFWNTSCCKDSRSGFASNIYLGPEERGYIRVLQSFADGLDPRLSPVQAQVSDPARVRGYALTAPSAYVAYLHAYTDHASPTEGILLTIDSPPTGTATWIDPASGAVLGSAAVATGRQSLAVPAFTVDIALRISPLP